MMEQAVLLVVVARRLHLKHCLPPRTELSSFVALRDDAAATTTQVKVYFAGSTFKQLYIDVNLRQKARSKFKYLIRNFIYVKQLGCFYMRGYACPKSSQTTWAGPLPSLRRDAPVRLHLYSAVARQRPSFHAILNLGRQACFLDAHG